MLPSKPDAFTHERSSEFTDSERSAIEKSVIETLAFFDLYSYPLTIIELRKFLWKQPTPDTHVVLTHELLEIVESMSQVEYVDGLISLQGRGKELRALRAERYLESERKYRLRLRYIRWLSYLPGVRAIFVVNSLSNQNVQRDSDIDLLIVARRGKIWSTRFFTTALAKLLGIRPRPERRQDALCLSFYIDESALQMQALSQHGQYEMFEAYWLRQMMPVYDPHTVRARIAAANPWLDVLLPNGHMQRLHPDRTIQPTTLHGILHIMFGWLMIEPLWRRLQLAVLPAKLKELCGPIESSVVVLAPELLKFHTKDPRVEWKQTWQNHVTELSQ